jgi:hypothetical protein
LKWICAVFAGKSDFERQGGSNLPPRVRPSQGQPVERCLELYHHRNSEANSHVRKVPGTFFNRLLDCAFLVAFLVRFFDIPPAACYRRRVLFSAVLLIHIRMAWCNSANSLVWQRHIAVPLWLLLAFLAIGERRAEATCGDYLAPGAASRGSLHALADGDEVARPELPARRPCHGPNCQGSRPQEPLPNPPPPSQVSERLLTMSVQAERGLMVIGRISPMIEGAPRDGFASELLRPPSYAL